MTQHHRGGSRLRRLPRPAGANRPPKQVLPPDPTETNNPYVVEIAGRIQRVCAIAHLSPYAVLNDWIGMLEAALRRYALNVKSYVTTGKFTEDPPEVQEIYRRARERYTEASKKYPATYREMQEAFSATFALLTMSAEPGLAAYVQSEHSPDVIGQVFLKCVNPGPAWWPYFPPWRAALAVAQAAIPNGTELIYSQLAEANLRYIEAVSNPIKPEPGEQFQAWFEAVLPYFEPILFGPALIGSSATLLAAAAQFPDWALERGLVQFFASSAEPLLERLMSINTMLYGLNGYEMDLINTANEIIGYYHEQEAANPFIPTAPGTPNPNRAWPELAFEPQTEVTNQLTNQAQEEAIPLRVSSKPKPAGPTFAELFKRKS